MKKIGGAILIIISGFIFTIGSIGLLSGVINLISNYGLSDISPKENYGLVLSLLSMIILVPSGYLLYLGNKIIKVNK